MACQLWFFLSLIICSPVQYYYSIYKTKVLTLHALSHTQTLSELSSLFSVHTFCSVWVSKQSIFLTSVFYIPNSCLSPILGLTNYLICNMHLRCLVSAVIFWINKLMRPLTLYWLKYDWKIHNSYLLYFIHLRILLELLKSIILKINTNNLIIRKHYLLFWISTAPKQSHKLLGIC